MTGEKTKQLRRENQSLRNEISELNVKSTKTDGEIKLEGKENKHDHGEEIARKNDADLSPDKKK